MTGLKDIYFDIVAILTLYEKGMATSDMLAAELRSIRNGIGQEFTESVRREAAARAEWMAEAAAARIL